MNQAMVADLGSEALNQLKSNLEIHGLKLVSPSLWLSSGSAAKFMNFLEHVRYRICSSVLYL